jgi:DNA-directed RNA polymerase alpha subunit
MRKITEQESNLPTDLSAPARRALVGAGYVRLEQLSSVSETEIKKLHGLGPKTIKQLRSALAAEGLSFGQGKSEKEKP